MSYQPIEDYGVIGDLNTVALVGMNGSIDFLCFPRFDSPSVFAALLDDERGGRFQIAPDFDNPRRRQLYLPDSNVLITRALSKQGVGEVVDFMPVEEIGISHDLMRRVTTVRGEVTYRMVCEPRFDYGRADHRVERVSDCEVVFTPESGSNPPLRLRSRVPLEVVNGAARAEFSLRSGESTDFVLESMQEGSGAPEASSEHVSRRLEETVGFWRSWIGRSTYKGRWREMVNRSALVLKLLFSEGHGSLVAAPTFGLPEEIGGERNWDYRYTWVRDSAFTLYALTGLGFLGEASRFMSWIGDRCGDMPEDGNGPLQVLYGIDGRRFLDEEVLQSLRGYRGSSPVRIGNAAYDQLQLDIYGELIDAIYLFNRHGAPISFDLWHQLTRLVDWVTENWRRPDQGIWEVRSEPSKLLYSRLMCWVAIDRAVRIAMDRSFPSPLDRWLTARDRIYADIYASFWSEDRKAFVESKGGSRLDAASLLMPMVRFISFTEPRWTSHLKAVEQELVADSLVHRYVLDDGHSDGLSGREGTFSMCSFWYVENLARAGRLGEARFYFEKMLGFANHLGLYSEQLGPTGEHLGNFPQAFTHLGLISAALALDQALSAAGWQA